MTLETCLSFATNQDDNQEIEKWICESDEIISMSVNSAPLFFEFRDTMGNLCAFGNVRFRCDASFSSRIECLEHKREAHASDWSVLREKNHVDELRHFVIVMDAIVVQNLAPGETAPDQQYRVSASKLACGWGGWDVV